MARLTLAAAALLALATSAQSCNRPNSVTIVAANGASNYELGYSIGVSSASYITAKMQTAQFQSLLSWVQSSDGALSFGQLQSAATAAFPEYIQELYGIADGATSTGAPVNRTAVWIFNMMDEIEAAMPPSMRMGVESAATSTAGADAVPRAWGDEACTDILSNYDPSTLTRWIAHNEDARRFNLGLMFLLDGQLLGSGGAGSSGSKAQADAAAAGAVSSSSSALNLPVPVATSLSFTAFMYPGQLASGAFGYNQHGFFFSTNAVFPVSCPSTLPPRAFLHRYLLESTSAADAVARMKGIAPSCGFSVNFGHVNGASSGGAVPAGETSLYNAETCSTLGVVGLTVVNGTSSGSSGSRGGKASLLRTAGGGASAVTQAVSGSAPVFFHANMYRTLDNSTAPQLVDDSSVARLARLNALPLPTPASGRDGLFQLLGDTANATYPIWRQGVEPDCCATIITATFEVQPAGGPNQPETGRLSLYSNNPKLCADSQGPVLVRSFP